MEPLRILMLCCFKKLLSVPNFMEFGSILKNRLNGKVMLYYVIYLIDNVTTK